MSQERHIRENNNNKKTSPSRIKTRLLDNDRCIYIGKNGENKQIDKQTDTTRIQMQSQFHRNCIYFIYFLFSFRNVSICMSLCISARARQWIERLSNIRMLETYGKYGFALVCFPFMNTREYQNHKYEWSQPCIDGQPSKKKVEQKNRNFQKMFPWKCYISVKLCSVWFESFFNMSFCSFSVTLFYFFLLLLPVSIGILIDSSVYFAICRRLDDKMLKFWWKYHRFEHIEYAIDTSWTQYMWRLIL